MKTAPTQPLPFLLLTLVGMACANHSKAPDATLINAMNLKRGGLVSCGPADEEYGTLAFDVTGTAAVKKDFVLGLKLLHSFEYDEAEKVFAGIIDKDPQCAMAYWGVAMSNFHALWSPPTEAEFAKGAKAVNIASSIETKTRRESAYIAAIGAYYEPGNTTSHSQRCLQFEQAMKSLQDKYPEDKEATTFYALALIAAADPADKTFTKQKKAGELLQSLYPGQANHPGVVHYIIHAYDAPELAAMGLKAAKSYAAIAPSSAHALHMPSHIFTRLGLWDECIASNLSSVNAAQCYATAAGIKGHWDEELHGLDYLVYAYLQKGANELARQQLTYLDTMQEVNPANFKVAYAFAAIPSRYVLENGYWAEAAKLPLPQKNFSWDAFPWQKAMVHFARIMGAVHTGNTAVATTELAELKRLHHVLLQAKDSYKAGQVNIQINTAEAWVNYKKGNIAAARSQMSLAADLEDKTEKHPVTPSELIPAREMQGNLLVQLEQWSAALAAYEASLQKHPNRFNGLYGAGLSAERLGNTGKATQYFQQLVRIASQANPEREELKKAKQFLEEATAGL